MRSFAPLNENLPAKDRGEKKYICILVMFKFLPSPISTAVVCEALNDVDMKILSTKLLMK